MMGPGTPFLAVSVLAAEQGGVALMASLVAAASLIQFAIAAWLVRLRRLLTPIVSGVAFMMIALSAMPIAFRRVSDAPDGSGDIAGLVMVIATLVVTGLLMPRGAGFWSLWAMPLGIAAGWVVALFFGAHDGQAVADSNWFGLPDFSGWPGLGSILTPDFWILLLPFIVVSAVIAVRTSSEGAAVQQASRRDLRAIDFRGVQRTINVSGIAILLSGLAGIPPVHPYLPSTIALISFTGVASRSAGAIMGLLPIILVLFPKTVAVLGAIPRPVSGALLMIVLGLLFVEGIRLVTRDGLNRQRALVVGLSLSIAVGLQSQTGLFDALGGAWAGVLGNSVLIGVPLVILLTLASEWTLWRRRRLELSLDYSSSPELNAFLDKLGSDMGWNGAAVERLRSAGEETLSAMLQLREDHQSDQPPRVVLAARPSAGSVELEFMALFSEENLEDRLAYIAEHAQAPDVDDISFRLLRHYAAAVQHRKYYGIDIVTVQVAGA